ncbi:MAG: 23S rRNA (guanosine(2251)-2'-O)-methyltransferase RlmB [Clostridium sp.]|uniref:23S rRNA (guanosine(2251)-2'-O)-methyltransferase RlmB n=1 Tax=Clostridium sp. TaxID=1506 RepID=UPI002FCC0EA7
MVYKNSKGNRESKDNKNNESNQRKESKADSKKEFRPDRRDNRQNRKEGQVSDVKEESESLIEGRNPVLEALKSGRNIDKIVISKGDVEGSIKVIISKARDKGIIVQEVDKKVLDTLSVTKSHQGVIAKVSPFEYSEVDDIFEVASLKGEDPFVIILDEIEDPHNFGSIIRTANACGAHGIIIPKRRSALVTQTVLKVSAGAAEGIKVAKVTNLNQTIKDLKARGLWIMGTDMDGEVCYKSNLSGPVGLVIGSEGHGMGRLIKESCDIIVQIPMKGTINSLNASVAGGIIMYEIVRQRG